MQIVVFSDSNDMNNRICSMHGHFNGNFNGKSYTFKVKQRITMSPFKC